MTTTGNWRRWGESDEAGALNLSTPDTVLAALRLPGNGKVYSLAHRIDENGPVSARRPPVRRITIGSRNRRGNRGSFDDLLVMHAHTGTHIDGLCHYWTADGGMYNGHDPDRVSPAGSPSLGIDHMAGLVTAAAYVDLRAVCPRGSDGHGFEITVAHLEKELARAGTDIHAGDVVLVRTGWEDELRTDRKVYTWGEPGIGAAAARWLAERDVVAVGADNWGVEAIPPSEPGAGMVVHSILLNEFGTYLIEHLSFAALGDDVETGRYLFVVAPLRISGGTGSPVNPLLIT